MLNVTEMLGRPEGISDTGQIGSRNEILDVECGVSLNGNVPVLVQAYFDWVYFSRGPARTCRTSSGALRGSTPSNAQHMSLCARGCLHPACLHQTLKHTQTDQITALRNRHVFLFCVSVFVYLYDLLAVVICFPRLAPICITCLDFFKLNTGVYMCKTFIFTVLKSLILKGPV